MELGVRAFWRVEKRIFSGGWGWAIFLGHKGYFDPVSSGFLLLFCSDENRHPTKIDQDGTTFSALQFCRDLLSQLEICKVGDCAGADPESNSTSGRGLFEIVYDERRLLSTVD